MSDKTSSSLVCQAFRKSIKKTNKQLPCLTHHKLNSCKTPSFPPVTGRRNKNSRGKHYVPCNTAALLHFCRLEMVGYLPLSDKLALQPTIIRTYAGFQQEVWT